MGIFKPKTPKPPPPPPLPDYDKEREEAAALLDKRRRGRKGLGGTVLTSAQGLTDEPTILSKKLLGA
jgi:hypothetical protein